MAGLAVLFPFISFLMMILNELDVCFPSIRGGMG
jgi:hypothetical protein